MNGGRSAPLTSGWKKNRKVATCSLSPIANNPLTCLRWRPLVRSTVLSVGRHPSPNGSGSVELPHEIRCFHAPLGTKNGTKNCWKTWKNRPKPWEAWKSWKPVNDCKNASYDNGEDRNSRRWIYGHDPLPGRLEAQRVPGCLQSKPAMPKSWRTMYPSPKCWPDFDWKIVPKFVAP